MKNFIYSQKYERVVPVIARTILGVFFLFAASGKIPGTEMFLSTTSIVTNAGIPFATLAVILALVLEFACSVALITGYHARAASLLLIPYVLLLTLLFHFKFTTQIDVAFFANHILLISGLLYVSVYGPEKKP